MVMLAQNSSDSAFVVVLNWFTLTTFIALIVLLCIARRSAVADEIAEPTDTTVALCELNPAPPLRAFQNAGPNLARLSFHDVNPRPQIPGRWAVREMLLIDPPPASLIAQEDPS